MPVELGLTTVDAPAQRVYTRARWIDPWVHEPHLWCSHVVETTSPQVGQARLVWDFGVGWRQGAMSEERVAPRDMLGLYVKVEIDQPRDEVLDADRDPLRWFGTVEFEERDVEGSVTSRYANDSSGVRHVSGRQVFTCLDLKHQLDRVSIDGSYVEVLADGLVPLAVAKLGRGIPFNKGSGESHSRAVTERANRSEQLGTDGVYVFAKYLHPTATSPSPGATVRRPQVWTAPQIIDYLLKYWGPRDANDQPRLPFERFVGVHNLDWHQPALEVHGRSVKQVLDDLLDRRRNLGWWLTVDATQATNERIYINTFSFNDQNVVLPSGAIVQASAAPITLDTDTDRTCSRVDLAANRTQKYDRVRVRGERRTSTFTLSTRDSTMFEDWDPDLEDLYKIGHSSGEIDERSEQGDKFRASDKFSQVYQRFKVDNAWDGTVVDPVGGRVEDVFPNLDETQVGQAAREPFWHGSLRFLRTLPLARHQDYDSNRIETGEAAAEHEAFEAMPAFVLLRVAGSEDTSDEIYIDPARNASAGNEIGLEGENPFEEHASVRMADDGPAVIVSFTPAHVLALGTFDDGSPAAGPTDTNPKLDYRDNLLATVAVEMDSYCEGVWPEGPISIPGDVLRELTVYVDQTVHTARLDYVVPGTVVGLTNHEPGSTDSNLLRSTGGYVRDDRERLEDLARMQYEWFSREHRPARIVYRKVGALLETGQLELSWLVTAIGGAKTGASSTNSIEVNSVVTSLAYDLDSGTTTVELAHGELDVTRV